MSKSISKYFDVSVTSKRSIWGKSKTRHYKCRKCSWSTSAPTTAPSVMSAMLTTQRLGLEIWGHASYHKNKKSKKKKKGKK